MGSKSTILPSIFANLPKADHFYDLFGGGFSVSYYALLHKMKKYKTIHYNEIQENTVALIKKAISGFYSYKNFKPTFITREDFFKLKDEDAYVKFCWSFGNNGESYMFGKDIEEYKRSIHMAVVFDEFNDIAFDIFGFRKWPKEVHTILKRRIYLRQRVSYLNTKRKQPLKRGELEQLQQLEQLQRLEQLQQLERLERLERKLIITAKDYREVEILQNSIIYCDPPYEKTASYGINFNKKEFLDWACNINHPVFISEYEIKDSRFKLIYEIDKRSLLSKDDNSKTVSEKLYWNGK